MADPGSVANLERKTLEAMKAIGKALGQMALYKVGHPAVIATISIAQENLVEALALSPNGELAIGIDRDKLILNARVVGNLSQLPASFSNLFNRFKLTSLSFKTGITTDDLIAFCELAAMRGDSPTVADPKAYLAGRSVTSIIFNEAVYLMAGESDTGPGVGEGPGDGSGGQGAGEGPVGAGAGDGGAAAQAAIQGIVDAIAVGSIERTIMALVEKAVPDPLLRKKIIEQVMKLLETDIAKRVEEVTVPLKREKKTLQNEAKRTDSVLSNMVEGVVVVDDLGKILMMNPAAEHIYGQTLAQSAGKSITDKPSEQFIVTMASDLTSPADHDIGTEVNLQGAADTQKTLRASSAVVKTEEGKIVGMVSALPDATKHKELQRMQRDFVAHVTHELRAPLSSIRAALEILQGQFANKIEEDEARMLNSALKNSDRLTDMISSILDFSKIESGQMEVFTKPTDAAKIARDAVDSLQPWARKKRIELTLSASQGLPVVDADAARTVQVIVNLLSNSIKFTPVGGKITVNLAKRAEGNQGFVEYAVADTGPGIAKSEQGKIFEKFVQIAAGETHVGGTGLGLSIAKALVHLQKGKMWIDSDVGQGATFLFTLPVYVAASAEASVVRTKAPPPRAVPWWKKLLGLK
ncbi:MAG: ATP-binding protein [Elusimicrobiota bacterium]